MEKRFTGLLIPILIATLVYLLFFADKKEDKPKDVGAAADVSLKDPAVQQAIQDQPSHEFDPDVGAVSHLFGELGHGGFEVVWSRYGAGIRAVTLNDHYETPEAAHRANKNPEDYYAIVPDYGQPVRNWGYGLVLEGRGRARFAKAIDDGDKHQLWDVAPIEAGDDRVKFTLDMGDGLILEKVFRYVPGRRDLELSINLRHAGKRPAEAPSEYQVSLRGVHVWNPLTERVFQNPAMAVGAFRDAEGTLQHVGLPAADVPGKQLFVASGGATFDYAGTTSRFFGGFLFPADDVARDAVTSVTCSAWPPSEVRVGTKIVEAGSVPEVRCQMRLFVPPMGETESLKFRLYLGPKSSTEFQGDYEPFLGVMDRDLEPMCCCPMPGVVELAQAIIWLLKGFQSVVGNWGVAIIMLTLLVRILLSPLNFNMQRTMRAHGAKMAKLKPQLDALQKEHKDDPKRLQMEMMKFNKEHKLITAPLKGCLPILVTMPIWFGLFTGLRVMYELRHEGFVGWIDDLSTPDRLFPTGLDWGPVAYFNFLPILMVGLWLYLQMGTPLPKDAQQRQMMVMMRFMPIMMGVMLYNYASGLMVYMCTSSVWGIVEQKITKKLLGPPPTDTGGMTPMPMM